MLLGWIDLGDSWEGLEECIAIEDGERQIACVVAFQGKEMVIEISLIMIGY